MTKLHILVVDDELDNRVMMRYFLESWGYEVTLAANGQEALEKVRAAAPDLVLLDLEMPVMNGFETCDRLKTNAETEHIPVIMFTGLEKTEDKVKGIRKGADDYVVKTVDPEELQARIEMVLRRSRRPAAEEEEGKALSGSLNDLYFPETMQLIIAYGKSGMLRLTNGGSEARVYLNEGHVVHAELDGREGEDAFYEMSLWKSGHFTFHVGDAPPRQTIRKSGTNLLLEATRRLDEWNLISTKIPSFNEVPHRIPLAGSDSIKLSRLDWRIISLADGQRTIQRMIEQLGLDPFEVGRTVFGLITVGVLSLQPAPAEELPSYEQVPQLAAEVEGDGLIHLTALQWKVLSRVDGRRTVSARASLVGIPGQAAAEMVENMAGLGWLTIASQPAKGRANGRPRAAEPPAPATAGGTPAKRGEAPRIRAIGLD
jgi:CheY-like chemotaxis protein